jgi:hypothetical protein
MSPFKFEIRMTYKLVYHITTHHQLLNKKWNTTMIESSCTWCLYILSSTVRVKFDSCLTVMSIQIFFLLFADELMATTLDL